MTAFAFCVLLLAANVIVYREAAVLLPVTGALVVLTGVRLVYLRRRQKSQPGRGTARTSGPGQPGRKGFVRPQPGRQGGITGPGNTARDMSQGPAGRGFSMPQQQGGKGQQLKKKGKDASVDVQREGNVLYASFPSTKEGRRRALEVFSKEKSASAEKDGQPLQ